MLETNEKLEIFSKETEDLRRNQIEILELKNKTIKIKSPVDRLDSRMKGTEERISELDDKMIESIQSE